MSSSQAQQPGRKRRAHKRSRYGCLTCKQRHVRCDENRPVCTNCLVRGSDCVYPQSSPAISSSATMPRLLSAVPDDPFHALPIDMPYRSQGLFHHYAHYRVLTRSVVPRNPDTPSVSYSMQCKDTFRACILLAAMHHSWIHGSLDGMQETYLYHKLEAMRLVNEYLTDPSKSISEACTNLIVALALSETVMGDIQAAETHLNGLFSILDLRQSDKWQSRFNGLIQRMMLMCGTLIAAAKPADKATIKKRMELEAELASPSRPHYTRPPGAVFCSIPYIATRLPPFYTPVLTPDIEACYADAEGEAVIISLRRLSRLPPIGILEQEQWQQLRRRRQKEQQLSAETAFLLLSDTEVFIASLLFKPVGGVDYHWQRRRQQQQQQRQQSQQHQGSTSPTTRSPSPLRARPTFPFGGPACSAPSSFSPINLALMSRGPGRGGDNGGGDGDGDGGSNEDLVLGHNTGLIRDPYADLPAVMFPSSSRAWTAAAYLYLHVMLKSWLDIGHGQYQHQQQQPLNPHILRWLLDTLRVDIDRTEEAMRFGAYSSEKWLWAVVVGAYAANIFYWAAAPGETMTDQEDAGSKGEGHGEKGKGKATEMTAENMHFHQMAGAIRGYAQLNTVLAAGKSSLGSLSPEDDNEEGEEMEEEEMEEEEMEEEWGGREDERGDDDDDDNEGEEEEEEENDDEEDDEEEEEEEGEEREQRELRPTLAQAQSRPSGSKMRLSVSKSGFETRGTYIDETAAWYAARMRVWSRATHVVRWESVREILTKIAWLDDWEGDAIVQGLWEGAIEGRS